MARRKNKSESISLRRLNDYAVGILLISVPLFMLFEEASIEGTVWASWGIAILTYVGIYWSEK